MKPCSISPPHSGHFLTSFMFKPSVCLMILYRLKISLLTRNLLEKIKCDLFEYSHFESEFSICSVLELLARALLF